MKRTFLAGTSVAAGLSLALAVGPALAQATSGFTAANVDPENPFGDLTVDTAVADVPAYLATIAPDKRLEIEQRCSVIVAYAVNYEAPVVTFCAAVVAATAPAAPGAPAM